MNTERDIVEQLMAGDLCDVELAPKAAALITSLRAELAGRDAEIIAWLQHTVNSTKIDVAEGLWAGIGEDADDFISTLRIIIDGIERGAYKDTDEARAHLSEGRA